ncbi:Uncharacterized protein APZ42_019001 [Daphnia magna]|uniref:Uncharacterized protein n=1 Tax=Daphnia magna TaxID=35525 RepID=A0A164YNJ7_9CRUS|nr:Uncharacterized protein APZ42_019001 [Daphnia magna]
MLGLGRVLPAPAAQCKSNLPPRSPPKFLAFSTRSLSSSTCSSDQSSSSRYSSSPSPGIHDQYNSPLQWPFSGASAASSGLFLEEVSEEADDDLDQWSEQHHHRLASTSPCSTLASSTYESSIDQGRRLAMSPYQLRHSTPNRSPYTERNRTANSNSSTHSTPARRSVVSSNNNNNNNRHNNGNGPGSHNKASIVEGKKKTPPPANGSTPLTKNKRVADLKSSGQPSTSRSSSPSLSRRNSAASSRSSASQTADASTTRRPIKSSNQTPTANNSTNNKQGGRPAVNSATGKIKTATTTTTNTTTTMHRPLANKNISNQKTGSKQQQQQPPGSVTRPPTTPTAKEDDEVVYRCCCCTFSESISILLFELSSSPPPLPTGKGWTRLQRVRRFVFGRLDGRSSSVVYCGSTNGDSECVNCRLVDRLTLCRRHRRRRCFNADALPIDVSLSCLSFVCI